MTSVETPSGAASAAGAVELAAGSTAPYLADFDAFSQARGVEAPTVQALRRTAIDRFSEVGFPTLRDEEWRFTNVAPIARGRFARTKPNDEVVARAAAVLAERGGFREHQFRLVFIDGHSVPSLARIPALPEGVFVGSLAAALAERPDLVTAHLGRQAKIGRHAFSALNSAFFADGAFVHVPKAIVVAEPLHLIFLASGDSSAAYPRNLFVLGENAQATIVETYEGLGGVSFTSAVTEIVAGPGAVLDHVKVQREDTQAFHVGHFALRQERASRIDSCSISIGAALARNDFEAVLDGEGADCILNGLYLVEGRQVVDHHMRVEHAKPHCTSHELFKGILDGKGRAVFNGLIFVHKGAQKTDAKQSNRNLLLSRDAIANSNPQLEIFADDVRCTHGSTVGQLDDDAVFYLRSRGIGEEAARSLLTYAFASDLVERLKVEPVRRELAEFLYARLPQGDVVRQAV